MVCPFLSVDGVLRMSLSALTAILLAPSAWSQQPGVDWQQRVRQKVRLHQFDAALALVDDRLTQDKSDLEARGWRGRLLAWQGKWSSAEAEYLLVLNEVPNDTEILCGLADVILWQGRPEEALRVIDRAREIDPNQPEILLRRAQILAALHNAPAARIQYRELLTLYPDNRDAKNGLAVLASENRNELRVGFDGSTFNYIGPAEDESLALITHWTPRFTTTLNTGFYQRFGQNAGNFIASSSLRVTKNDWLTIGGALANHQGIIPENEMFFEYGHGFRFSNRWIKGLEASYQQHWFWYEDAHVLTLNSTQLYYLPKAWTWTLSVTAARTGFAGTAVDWVPSGYTRLGFPLHRNLSGNVIFGNGTEDFAQIDQIGRFSARTYGGGLKCGITAGQDVTGYVALQDRSSGETENSFGVSYGFHF
jgi:tetratricopeptide (TPR) repeat protein